MSLVQWMLSTDISEGIKATAIIFIWQKSNLASTMYIKWFSRNCRILHLKFRHYRIYPLFSQYFICKFPYNPSVFVTRSDQLPDFLLKRGVFDISRALLYIHITTMWWIMCKNTVACLLPFQSILYIERNNASMQAILREIICKSDGEIVILWL